MIEFLMIVVFSFKIQFFTCEGMAFFIILATLAMGKNLS